MKEVADDDSFEEVTILGHGKEPKLKKISYRDESPSKREGDQFEVFIKDWVSDKAIRIETHFFNVRILSKQTGRDWLIQRRYSDFEWLFKVQVILFRPFSSATQAASSHISPPRPSRVSW